jgi:hypothetical protein
VQKEKTRAAFFSSINVNHLPISRTVDYWTSQAELRKRKKPGPGFDKYGCATLIAIGSY